jgi:hypothetical protein
MDVTGGLFGQLLDEAHEERVVMLSSKIPKMCAHSGLN